ncbi:MAG: hypothetical protein KDA44_00420 [Planctomycetales bacterium]|nr:hypothetical protein [Planctomycetales bacterium]
MNSQLDKLIERVFQDPGDEAALQELSVRLAEHPDEREAYLQYCRVHCDLAYLASADGAERRALGNIASRALSPGTDAPEPLNGPKSSVKRNRGVWFLFALAASVAIAFPWLRGGNRPSPQVGLRQPTIVASLVSAEDAIWQNNVKSYADGESLRIGSHIRLQRGLVKVNTPTGAELLIEGPCDVVLEAPDRVVLHEGKLTARMADWASGFTVETQSLTVVDLGALFAVAVDAKGNAEAHALEGSVRVQPLAEVDTSRTSFLLTEGEAVRVNRAALTTTRLPAQQERFVLSHGAFRPYRPIEIHNTGRDLAVGDEDPNWRIVNGAVGASYQGPQYAVVCEADERYLPNHALVSQWMSVARDLRPGCLPNSIYTFQTEVDLTGYDLSTVTILADMLADNGVAEVRINGRTVDLAPWRDNEYLQEFSRFRRAEIVDGFVPGRNVIEIDVLNGVYHFDPKAPKQAPTPNPMALRVEWQAFGTPLPAVGGDSTI